MSANHETVGQAAYRLLLNPDSKQGIVDTQREMLKGYYDELIVCAKRYDWHKPFYVCVKTSQMPGAPNTIRNRFFARQTRPRPEFDLALYAYDPKEEKITFEWAIPDQESFNLILENANRLPKDQLQLLDMCLRFKAGTLR